MGRVGPCRLARVALSAEVPPACGSPGHQRAGTDQSTPAGQGPVPAPLLPHPLLIFIHSLIFFKKKNTTLHKRKYFYIKACIGSGFKNTSHSSQKCLPLCPGPGSRSGGSWSLGLGRASGSHKGSAGGEVPSVLRRGHRRRGGRDVPSSPIGSRAVCEGGRFSRSG